MALRPRNANDIVIERLRVRSTGAAIEDATLTAVVTDETNGAVIDTVALAHVSDGNYFGTTTAQLTVGIFYKVVVTSALPYRFSRQVIEPCIPPE